MNAAGCAATRIADLLATYCPDGVEYKAIKEVYTRLRGTPITARKMKEIASDDGEIKIFAGGKTVINAHEKDIPHANIIDVPAVLIQSRGVIDAIYYERPFTFKNEMWAYTAADKDSVKYLYYVIKNNIEIFRNAASGMGSLPQISLSVTEDFQIPVPPLDAQREIVRILDTFTALTTELQTHLQAERTQRLRQYEYYRDMLLSEGYLNVLIAKELQAGRRLNRVRLGDVGIFTRGNGLQKKDFRTDGHPVIHYGQIYTSYGFAAQNAISYVSDAVFTRLRKARTGALLIATTSENIEDVAKCVVWEGSKEVGFSGDMYSFQTTENPRYLAYFFQTNDFQRQKEKKVTGTKVNRIHGDDLAQIELLLPPPDIQQEVVRVLDKFQEYVAEVDGLLPQEIAQRQKQYAYYREKLLTFDMESAKHTHTHTHTRIGS